MTHKEKIEWLVRQAKVYRDRYNNQCDYLAHLEELVFDQKRELEDLRHWKKTITDIQNKDIPMGLLHDLEEQVDEGFRQFCKQNNIIY